MDQISEDSHDEQTSTSSTQSYSLHVRSSTRVNQPMHPNNQLNNDKTLTAALLSGDASSTEE
jgi:hypothetical protein